METARTPASVASDESGHRDVDRGSARDRCGSLHRAAVAYWGEGFRRGAPRDTHRQHYHGRRWRRRGTPTGRPSTTIRRTDARASARSRPSHEQDATEECITELYTRAVDQLGAEDTPVRIGGLHALERLAQNNPAQSREATFAGYILFGGAEFTGNMDS